MINLKPIDQLPDGLKDGRPVLLWVNRRGSAAVEGRVHQTGRFEEWSDWAADFVPINGSVTHFSEINAPGVPQPGITDSEMRRLIRSGAFPVGAAHE